MVGVMAFEHTVAGREMFCGLEYSSWGFAVSIWIYFIWVTGDVSVCGGYIHGSNIYCVVLKLNRKIKGSTAFMGLLWLGVVF